MSVDNDATTVDIDAPIVVSRRRIDQLLIGFGIVATLVLAVAGGLLTWGANFSDDHVYRELSSQNVFFPDEESLRGEGRDDLVKYAGKQVTTGDHARAYASFIEGHLVGIADGQTYSEVDDAGARAAVAEARESGASEAEIAELQAEADDLTQKRDSLFKGETLRGLLLSAYAWATIGQIAAIASYVVFAAAALMLILTIAGLLHLRKHAPAD